MHCTCVVSDSMFILSWFVRIVFSIHFPFFQVGNVWLRKCCQQLAMREVRARTCLSKCCQWHAQWLQTSLLRKRCEQCQERKPLRKETKIAQEKERQSNLPTLLGTFLCPMQMCLHVIIFLVFFGGRCIIQTIQSILRHVPRQSCETACKARQKHSIRES